MPIPERFLRLFAPELQAGEEVRSVANADLWLRYRRLALTDRRLLVVERGGVRRPLRGRAVTSLPLAEIAAFRVCPGRIQWQVTFRTRQGVMHGFALPAFSRGTPRFGAALRRALAEREAAWIPTTTGGPRCRSSSA